MTIMYIISDITAQFILDYSACCERSAIGISIFLNSYCLFVYIYVSIASTMLNVKLFLFLFYICDRLYFRRYDGDMFGVFERLAMSPSFWLLTVVIVVACLIPDYLFLMVNSYRPMQILRRNEALPQIISDDNESSSSYKVITKTINIVQFFYIAYTEQLDSLLRTRIQ